MRAKITYLLLIAMAATLVIASCEPRSVSRTAQTQTALAEAIGLPATLAAGATAVALLTQAAPMPAVPAITPTEIPSPSDMAPTAVQATLAAPTITALPTANPTMALPSPALPSPYPTPKPSPVTRVSFQSGATSANVEGEIAANAEVRYRLRALAQQILIVTLDSPNSDLHLSIRGESDGRTLLSAEDRSSYYRGQLPRTQDYRIAVHGAEAQTHYNLSITIPKRIAFRSGTTSARLEGNIKAYTTINYLARARAGQTMTVTITAPTNDVLLTIYGLDDGQPLVRAASGATSWSGTLPGTQDYMIDVVATDAARRYVLDVAIK